MGLYIWNIVNSFCVCVYGGWVGGGGGKRGSLNENSSKREVFRLFIFMPRHKKWRGIMLYPPNF